MCGPDRPVLLRVAVGAVLQDNLRVDGRDLQPELLLLLGDLPDARPDHIGVVPCRAGGGILKTLDLTVYQFTWGGMQQAAGVVGYCHICL